MSRRRGLRRLALPFCCAALAACFTAPAPVTGQETSPAARATPLFDFHSNFWVNLHQVLLHEAKLRAGKLGRQVQSAPPLSAAGLRKPEEANWNTAVRFYAVHFADRPQHGDDELIQINDDLAGQPDNGAKLNPAGLPPELAGILQRAAVTYRRYWWPAHNESNQRWIASQRQRVRDLGPQLASAMTKDLHQSWPAAPIRVDICYYVVALGYAFTTLPPHTTLAGSDPTGQDLSGFELLFHEASHTFADAIRNALSVEGDKQHKEVGDLWHAVLFYTSGVELRRLLPASEQASFAPYAYRYGVFNGGWAKYRPLLETDWQAYLAGKTGFDSAIAGLVTSLP